MKVRYLKFKNWLILTLMGALGLGACSSQKRAARETKPDAVDQRGEMMLMYGVPTRNFVVQQEAEEAELEVQAREETPVMYGVPTTNFRVKGTVVDETGKPVAGVQVVLLTNAMEIDPERMPETPYMEEYLRQSADTTSQDGHFVVTADDRPWNTQRLLIRDIDGAKNGRLKNEILTVDFEESDVETTDSMSRTGKNVKERKLTVTVKKQ
ncbi:MAG: radical SAM-associated putative lipoprotein [Bacteroidales bacterium]|nr:radical SAM-associated putative lipoprotein [Bacteroidales bacterium]